MSSAGHAGSSSPLAAQGQPQGLAGGAGTEGACVMPLLLATLTCATNGLTITGSLSSISISGTTPHHSAACTQGGRGRGWPPSQRAQMCAPMLWMGETQAPQVGRLTPARTWSAARPRARQAGRWR